ncbi:MgtC/SapB family protein [Rheinheimera maricola]|uniref:MgtC/SapB family protein n=1 Tax=Rheinheimera maricola TaxID=2793282 RepID=A0ABS7XDU6_9GAMM|nr:MgtC/SapB family protein [Rheinheimera maricola]MBZ9613735.1 MgtC/SapB family protein [Rheinheimera maricola]
MSEFDFDMVQSFLIALLLGALVGIEREKHRRDEHPNSFGGLRTYILFAQAGAVSAWLSIHLQSPWLFVVTVLVVAIAVLTAYILENRHNPTALGLTSEISAITVCLLGGATMFGYAELAVMLGILTSAILTFKQPLHGLVSKIDTDDLYAGLKLLIASFIILPLLPNETIDPWQALNPYKLWLLVILISSMSLLGYVAVRWLGAAHGAVVTGISGGLASSTAVTLSFARSSKIESDPLAADHQACGVLLAWLVMFIRVLVTISIVYQPLLVHLLLPFSAMAGATAIMAALYYWHGSRRYQAPQQSTVKVTNPFSLVAAIKFGALFAVILFLVKLNEQYAAAEGLYLLAAVAGMTDVDAITLSMAQYAGQSAAALSVAAGAVTVAALSNTLVKCGLVYALGGRALARKLVIATLIILTLGIAVLLFG